MKRIHIVGILITYYIIFSFLLSGCGDGPGAPGSEGSEDTGIDIRILGVTNNDPNGDIGDVWTIDFVQDVCESGDAETFGDNFANITFFGQPIHPTIKANPNILYVTNYRVTFSQLDPTFPPIDEIRAGTQGSVSISANNQTGPFSFLILDVGRKVKLYDDITGPFIPSSLPLLYDMTIEMWGEDMYGQSFKAPVIIRQIILNDYNNC